MYFITLDISSKQDFEKQFTYGGTVTQSVKYNGSIVFIV